jgi:mannitol/fructose-specific phosphotransferase system IIA component (Ntr-type)
MITIANTLRRSAINLELEADTPASALYEVASMVRDDDRVKDWEALLDGLGGTVNCVVDEPASALCLPHARTDAVRTMVMSAGRSREGIAYPGTEKPVRYLFVIGVPKAMASDYLRIVGALMRILRQDGVERQLRSCATPADFQTILANCEMKF